MGWRLTHDPNFGLDGLPKPKIRSGLSRKWVGVAVSIFAPTTDPGNVSDLVILQSIEAAEIRFPQISENISRNICRTYRSGKKVSANQKEKSMT